MDSVCALMAEPKCRERWHRAWGQKCYQQASVHEKAGVGAGLLLHTCGAPSKGFTSSWKASLFQHSLTEESIYCWTTATLEIQVCLPHGLQDGCPELRTKCSCHLKKKVQQGTAGWSTLADGHFTNMFRKSFLKIMTVVVGNCEMLHVSFNLCRTFQ